MTTIDEKYAAVGGLNGSLGSAVGSEMQTPSGAGSYRHYQGGSIYWTPEYGACALSGPILERWQALGAEVSWLGYPVSDELRHPTAQSSHVVFEHGIVEHTEWNSIDGGGVRIAVGPDGQPWLVNSTGQIFNRQGHSWGRALPGLGKDIGVGADGSVWLIGTNSVGVGSDFGVYKWNGTSWNGVDGGGVGIAVGPDGQPWIVNSAGQIFRRQGNSWGSPLPGLGKDIGIGGDGSVWLVGTNPVGSGSDFGVYKWNGTGWNGVDGGGVRIAVGPDGQPSIVNSAGEIFHRRGNSWSSSRPGLGKDIGIGADGSVWLVGTNPVGTGSDFGVFRRNVSSDASATIQRRHDYLRIYGAIRHQILSRFFALGFHGRRNWLVTENEVKDDVPDAPPGTANHGLASLARRARWNTIATGGENPHLFGTWLLAMLAVEHAAGNDESTQALRQHLDTLEELSTAIGTGQIPTRWDAGAPTDDMAEHVQQFLPRDGEVPSLSVRHSDFHHHPWRLGSTLRSLMSEEQAQQYESRGEEYVRRYRYAEPSMDEVVGMVTSMWLVNTLATTSDLRQKAQSQARRIGEYLASNGYLMVRPVGGLSWRGATGTLPMMEEPLARALATVTGDDWHSRADFRQAMELAGHWRQLAGPIEVWQVSAWVTTLSQLVLNPAMVPLAARIGALELTFANQVLSPSTVGAAAAVALGGHSDCLDVRERDELAVAILAKDAPNKSGLYRAFIVSQAAIAQYDSWSVHYPAFLSLTGLDHPDPLVRDVFRSWFDTRSSLPAEKEPRGLGAAVSCWTAAVATILETHSNAETRLLARLDEAICTLFRSCYYDPQIPIVRNGSAVERLLVWRDTGPYGPLDYCGAIALACWHARRRESAGRPVTTAAFPQSLTNSAMADWPRAGVPVDVLDILESRNVGPSAIQAGGTLVAVDGVYPVFMDPPVPRRRPPTAPLQPATSLVEDKVFFVDPRSGRDLATGIVLHPGQALQVTAEGDIWAGVPLDGRNSPDGHDRLIDDARWPLHTGLDTGNARAFCLLGRLNGYFFVGSHFSVRKWMFHEPRELHLRINDVGPGDGNGAFIARVCVFDSAGSVAVPPYHLLRNGGLMVTDEPRDRIFVKVEPAVAGSGAVEFVLETPDDVTWRKELVLASGNSTDPGSWTLWTQDARHRDASGLWVHQLAGGFVALRRLNPFPSGMTEVRRQLRLDEARPDTRITLRWYQD